MLPSIINPGANITYLEDWKLCSEQMKKVIGLDGNDNKINQIDGEGIIKKHSIYMQKWFY